MYEWINLTKAADILNKSREYVRQLCIEKAFISYKVSFGSKPDDKRAVFVIPKDSFIQWVESQPKQEVAALINKKEFTMNCLSTRCAGYYPKANGVVKFENKFVSDCPDCKCALKKTAKRSK